MCDTFAVIASPIGRLFVASTAANVSEIRFHTRMSSRQKRLRHDSLDGIVKTAVDQLESYFRGELQEFNLPLSPGGTSFQQRVWAELRRIPYGETASYGDIAKRIGSPGAARAVGAANGSNPIPIVIPCHRVIGSDGSLTGFGGGLKIKKWLLELEREYK